MQWQGLEAVSRTLYRAQKVAVLVPVPVLYYRTVQLCLQVVNVFHTAKRQPPLFMLSKAADTLR